MMIREGRRGAGRLRKDGRVLSAQAGAAQGQRTGTYIRNQTYIIKNGFNPF
eukprot:COSAG06_NODE_10528_length_1664_cov_692.892013_4_plen_50_part_01